MLIRKIRIRGKDNIPYFHSIIDIFSKSEKNNISFAYFIRFLKEKGIFTLYLKYTKQLPTILSLVFQDCITSSDYLATSFPFSKSIEGHSFWMRLSMLWRKLLTLLDKNHHKKSYKRKKNKKFFNKKNKK